METIREKAVQEFNDCDYIAEKISIAHRWGLVLRVSYNAPWSGAEEIVGSVSPLDCDGFHISNVTGIFPIPYCAVLVSSVYVPEPPRNDRKERGFPELVGKCGFAKRRCHGIEGYWCGHKDCPDYIPEGKKDDPSDVAKERWEVHWDGPNSLIIDGDGLHLAKRINASGQAFAEMAAGREMLDWLEELNDGIIKTGHFGQDDRMVLFLKREYIEELQAIIKRARGGESDGMGKT